MGSHAPGPPFNGDPTDPGNAGHSPEALPPEGGQPQPEPRRRDRPYWQLAPATHVLVAINCAVYLAMVVRGISFWAPNGDQLMRWGADNAGSVLVYGQWWRILTAMFVHGGFIHLAANMWCLWNLGLLAEPLMGAEGVLAVYILSGAAGNLLSNGVNWAEFSVDWFRFHDLHSFPSVVGASGAVFGIAGALIVLLKSNRLPVPKVELNRLRRSVIYFAAINFVIGFGVNRFGNVTGVVVDNMNHLGGCAGGLIFAAPMIPRPGSDKTSFLFRRRVAIVAMTGLLVLFSFFLVNFSRQS